MLLTTLQSGSTWGAAAHSVFVTATLCAAMPYLPLNPYFGTVKGHPSSNSPRQTSETLHPGVTQGACPFHQLSEFLSLHLHAVSWNVRVSRLVEPPALRNPQQTAPWRYPDSPLRMYSGGATGSKSFTTLKACSASPRRRW